VSPSSGVGGAPGEVREFVHVGVAAGRIDEARREAPGARLEGPGEQSAHPGPLVGRGGAVGVADDRRPDGAVPGQQGAVDAARRRFGPVEILGGRLPVQRQAVPLPLGLPARAELADQRKRARAAVARHVGRDARQDLALGPGIHERRKPAVAVDVDESGRKDEARGVEVGGGGLQVGRNPPDSPVANQNIGTVLMMPVAEKRRAANRPLNWHRPTSRAAPLYEPPDGGHA